MESAKVVVLGSANADLVVRSPRHPQPGETLMGTDFATHRGGKGANQAVAAARAGAAVSMIGRLGPDDNGRFLREGLRAEGIDDRFVGTCKHDPTGVALITVDDNGENTIVVVGGANSLLRTVHVDDAVDAGLFDGGGVLLAQLETPVEVVLHALIEAKQRGMTTLLNAAPARTLPAELLATVDVLVVNEHELLVVASESDFERALDAVGATVPTVVVTLGAAGARLRTGDLDQTFASHRVVVVDTTGAGDAFCGAFAAALAPGQSVEEAVRFGIAAGALACSVAGAQPSAPLAEAIRSIVQNT